MQYNTQGIYNHDGVNWISERQEVVTGQANLSQDNFNLNSCFTGPSDPTHGHIKWHLLWPIGTHGAWSSCSVQCGVSTIVRRWLDVIGPVHLENWYVLKFFHFKLGAL